MTLLRALNTRRLSSGEGRVFALVSAARGISRRDVLVQMLQREAKQFAHEHMVAQRILGGQSVMQELADAKLEDEPQIGG